MTLIFASWHKTALFTIFAVACSLQSTLLGTMMAGHGQLDDQKLAKRIRVHLVDSKMASAAALDEQASNLRSEANMIIMMSDEELLSNYKDQLVQVDGEEIAPEMLGSGTFVSPMGSAGTPKGNFFGDCELALGQTWPETQMQDSEDSVGQAKAERAM